MVSKSEIEPIVPIDSREQTPLDITAYTTKVFALGAGHKKRDTHRLKEF